MKDIVIKGDRLKKEIIIWLICLVAAEGVNVYSIISYKTDWIELITQLHFTAVVSFLFYSLTVVARYIFSFLKNKKK